MFSHFSIRNFKCDVYLEPSPILIHSMPSASVTECMLGFLTLEPLLLWKVYLYFHICQLPGGGGGWKNENSGDPNKPVQSPWYEPGLSE